MRDTILYNRFLEEIFRKLPQKIEVVNTLSDLLCIGKEAVYRRLRKEVPFTFFEAMTISRELGIPLDGLDIDSFPMSSCELQLIDYVNPAPSDYARMETMTRTLNSIDEGDEAEAGEITNILPQILYVSYRNIFRFYLFKWKYYSNREKQAVPYRDIIITDRLQKIQQEYVRCAKRWHINYIFDPMLYQDLVHKIEYFF